MSALEAWALRQREHAIAGLLRSISSSVTRTRAHFGQVIVPRKGSVIASPLLTSYDPDPDYFFHWYRDSALVMDALRLVQRDVPQARQHFQDFVYFSLDLAGLDGRQMVPDWQARADPQFVRFLRRDIATAHNDAIPAETRVNPDGTLDITDWPRPQHDGPAMRALTLLRWEPQGEAEIALLCSDLAFILDHARKPCFDIWEEEIGLHYYTLCVCEAALRAGAKWLMAWNPPFAERCLIQAHDLSDLLQGYWSSDGGFIRSRMLPEGRVSKELDVAVILAANHAQAVPTVHLNATLDRLADLFGRTYAINRNAPLGPAMGRYEGDIYYSGGAYYFSTLGAAEYCYRSGDRLRGDAFLETVRCFLPDSGTMSEQFDQSTGAPTSSKDLAWSYAAFLSCMDARQNNL